MNLRFVIAFGIAMLASACWWPGPEHTVTPTQVRRNIWVWDGKLVTVGGWLGKCSGLDCMMFTSQSDMQAAEMRNSGTREWDRALDRGLGIGFNRDFDRSAAALQWQFVLIRGRVNDHCRGLFGLCYDRTSDLEPISIQPGTPPRNT